MIVTLFIILTVLNLQYTIRGFIKYMETGEFSLASSILLLIQFLLLQVVIIMITLDSNNLVKEYQEMIIP